MTDSCAEAPVEAIDKRRIEEYLQDHYFMARHPTPVQSIVASKNKSD